jgi:hypothetical protein
MQSLTIDPRVVPPSEVSVVDVGAASAGVAVVEGVLDIDGPFGTEHRSTSCIGSELLTRLGQMTIARLCASMRFTFDRRDTSCSTSKTVLDARLLAYQRTA